MFCQRLLYFRFKVLEHISCLYLKCPCPYTCQWDPRIIKYLYFRYFGLLRGLISFDVLHILDFCIQIAPSHFCSYKEPEQLLLWCLNLYMCHHLNLGRFNCNISSHSARALWFSVAPVLRAVSISVWVRYWTRFEWWALWQLDDRSCLWLAQCGSRRHVMLDDDWEWITLASCWTTQILCGTFASPYTNLGVLSIIWDRPTSLFSVTQCF